MQARAGFKITLDDHVAQMADQRVVKRSSADRAGIGAALH